MAWNQVLNLWWGKGAVTGWLVSHDNGFNFRTCAEFQFPFGVVINETQLTFNLPTAWWNLPGRMEVWSPCLLSGLYWKYLGARRRRRFGYYWQSSLQEPIRFDLLNCLPADPVWFSIMPEHRKITWTTATIIIIPVKMNKIETNEKLWSSSSNTRIFAGNVEVEFV